MSISPASFTHQTYRTELRFDVAATVEAPRALEALGASAALIIIAPGDRSAAQAAPLVDALAGRTAALFAAAAPHVPAATLDAAIAAHGAARADSVLAIGGGSAIGLGKLVAAATGTPAVAVPTTYSGAELTPFNAVTADGVKRQRRDAAMVPRVVLYDVALLQSLPSHLAACSAMNALAHAIEALYAPDANPLAALSAAEAVRLAGAALPALAEGSVPRAATRDLLLAAMLAGQALAATTMGLHHKLCHVLGGRFGLPHAEVNAVILPYAMAYNAAAAPAVFGQLAALLGSADPAGCVHRLGQELGTPRSLAALGLPAAALGEAADALLAQTFANPAALRRDALLAMLADAHAGAPPDAFRYAGRAAAA